MKLTEASLLINGFEDCSLPKEAWTHAAHFVMAFWYCVQHPLPIALDKIRQGIKTYNAHVNPGSTGYHETITVFYTMTVANYLLVNGISEINDNTLCHLLEQPFLAKDHLSGFYTPEMINSSEARSTWVPPLN